MNDLTCKTTGMTRRQLEDALHQAKSRWLFSVKGTPEYEAAAIDLRLTLSRLNMLIRRSR